MKLKLTGFVTLVFVLLMQIAFAQAQTKTVSGVVSDEDGLPVPGVNITIQGTSTGTATDFDGNYSIEAEEGQVLVFSAIGFQEQTATVGTSSSVSVTMAGDSEQLDEVQIVGYSNRKREVLTSAISTVDSKKIEQMVPTTTLDNMLQGNASGVQVVTANGKPGQNAFVRVRGQGSLQPGGGAPLYIVDGVPIAETYLNAINPSDVEDIKILKDAATTAQYGSRGANGVVVITTKSGKYDSEGVIKLSSRIGFTSKTSDHYKMMNLDQKLAYEKELGELGINSSLPGYMYRDDEEELQKLRNRSTDWRDVILRDGLVQSNSLAMSGGSEDSNYYFSVGHDRDEGILNEIIGFEKISAKVAGEHKVKDWLNLRTNVSYSRTYSDETRDRDNAQNPFSLLYTSNPYQAVYRMDDDGNILYDEDGNPLYDWGPSDINPVEYLKTTKDKRIGNTLIGNVGMDIDIVEGLSYTFNAGIIHRRLKRESYSVPGNRLDQLISSEDEYGSLLDQQDNTLDYTITNLLNYNISANGHNIDLTGLQEYNFNEFNSTYAFFQGFANENLQTGESAGKVVEATTNRNRLTLFSLAGIANYDYEGKYLFSGSFRRDGSSNFGADYKYGNFWSVSAGWNIANEDFFNAEWVDNLKLRASYGTTGNRNIGRYRYAGTVQYASGYPGGVATVPNNIENPELQWEESKSIDVGLEFGLFNNRLRGVVDYYKRNTDNLLFDSPTSYESGIPGLSIASNLGEIENSGIELELSGDIIRNNDWSWTVGGNITFYDSKIVSLKGLPDADGFEAPGTYMQYWEKGGKINQFYLLDYAGIDDTNGRPLYYGGDGNTYYYDDLPTDMENRILKGSVFAKFEGGFNTSVAYKGLSLNADFVYKGGNYIYNLMYQRNMSDGQMADANQAVDAANFWREPGDASKKGINPSPEYGNEGNQNSTRFLEKGDYIRLRNVTLAYDFPKSMFQNSFVDGIRVYAQGQNLLTWTKFHGDPEVGISSGETVSYGETVAPGEMTRYSYPNRKTVSFGVDITL